MKYWAYSNLPPDVDSAKVVLQIDPNRATLGGTSTLPDRTTFGYRPNPVFTKRPAQGAASTPPASTIADFTLPNGDHYKGEVVNGKCNGKGVYTFANGDHYAGDFVDGKMDGRGIFTSSNGRRYEGDFVDDKMNGNCTIFAPDGSVLQKGIWKDNTLVESH